MSDSEVVTGWTSNAERNLSRRWENGQSVGGAFDLTSLPLCPGKIAAEQTLTRNRHVDSFGGCSTPWQSDSPCGREDLSKVRCEKVRERERDEALCAADGMMTELRVSRERTLSGERLLFHISCTQMYQQK
jgi:hypothetical protein